MLFFTLVAIKRGSNSGAIYAAAVGGGLIAFLMYNFNPAKIFMGDTGSLFLGGAVCALAFTLDMPLILLIVGFIYMIELLSVILQVSYFKLTHGKRIFKMSPIHHHFELCGWGEKKLCFVFGGITLVLCCIAWLLIF
jgi:phospho-N-acetylmuramoyl-pentapeptide-transferase